MAIETTCGGCGKQLSVGDEHAGRRARCPACGQIYTIPSPDGAPPELPAIPTGPQPLPTGSQAPQSDSFAATTAGPASSSEIPSLPTPAPAAAENLNQFWMRSTEGAEYGPVDGATLNRWFNEGRVGPGYLMRQLETGMWQPADVFNPNAQRAGIPNSPNSPSSANPFAAAPVSSVAPTYRQMYPKPDQSGLVLAFGILAWFICPIFGIVAWIMGQAGLRDIRLGLVDPSNKGLMLAGYYLGMVNVIICLLCGGGYFVFIALMVLTSAMH